MKIPILFGPTAVGKTELILSLCRDYPIEVISMDSMQIYRQMYIGTAKPSKEELSAAKHWMIDILDPQEEYNAYRYRSDALRVIDDILSRKKNPDRGRRNRSILVRADSRNLRGRPQKRTGAAGIKKGGRKQPRVFARFS